MSSVKSSRASDSLAAGEESYGVTTEPGTLRLERLLPGSAERVWSYLTDSKLRGKWLATGEMELRVGGRVQLHFHHADLSRHLEAIPEKYRDIEKHCDFEGRITRCEPPRLLSYTWGESSGPGPGANSEVTFELTPQGANVLMTITHRKLRSRDELISVAGGWHVHVGILIDVLRGIEPRAFWSTHTRLEADYQKRL